MKNHFLNQIQEMKKRNKENIVCKAKMVCQINLDLSIETCIYNNEFAMQIEIFLVQNINWDNINKQRAWAL